jgi:predicted nuclease of predicted toxin-antitoxin system
MRLLLDQGLPRSTVHHLDAAGVESAHVGEKGLATASDAKIIDFARQGGWIVVTLDADFHTLLAL